MHQVNQQIRGVNLEIDHDRMAARFRRQATSSFFQTAAPTTFDTFFIPSSSSSSVGTSRQPVITTSPAPFPSSLQSNNGSDTTIFDRCTTCDSPSSSTPTSTSTTPSSTSSRFSTSTTSSSQSVEPAVTGLPQTTTTSSRKGPTLGIALGVALGCLVLICTALCCVLVRRKRRGRRTAEERKVERPFGQEAGFHLVAETGASPTSINPFSALPSSRSTAAPASSPSILSASQLSQSKSLKSSLVEPPGSAVTGSPDSGTKSEVTGAAAPTMASPQNLLEQLSALRAQIQQVEALARTQGLNPSSSTGVSGASTSDDSLEPPPEYDASMGAAAQGLARSGKTAI